MYRPLLPRIVARYPELSCELVLTDQLVDLVDDNIDLALRLTRRRPADAVAKKAGAYETGHLRVAGLFRRARRTTADAA